MSVIKSAVPGKAPAPTAVEPSAPASETGPLRAPERWTRLSKRDGATEVLELVTQEQLNGSRAVLSRKVRVERDIRAVQYAKAMQALEENAG